MNSLSWMIYLAEVAGNIQGTLIASAVVGGVAIGVAIVVFSIATIDGEMPAGSWRKPLKFIPLVVFAAILAAAIPSSRAVYMIAASEAGEAVVKSPEAKDMLGDLKEIIRRKLKEQLSETGV